MIYLKDILEHPFLRRLTSTIGISTIDFECVGRNIFFVLYLSMIQNAYANKEIPLLDGQSVFVSPIEYAKYVEGVLSLPDIISKYCVQTKARAY